MNKKYQLIIILSIFVNLSSCTQEKKDDTKPKHFINEETFNLDLIGKTKEVKWVVVDSIVSGNTGELYKGNFKGTTDSIQLNFNENQKINYYKITKHSIRTSKIDKVNPKKLNIIYKNEEVLITSDSGKNSEDENYYYLFQDFGYEDYIDEEDENKLYLGNNLFTNKYNKYGDVIKIIWNTKREKDPKVFNFYYKYDNNGNWIERIEIRTLNNGNTFEWKRDSRDIQYYEQ